ncbi:MAG: alpha/beta hydrolase [Acidobacteriia bacterium]|nr:alpha/beta hydrolase [Terriglobia bacterium]
MIRRQTAVPNLEVLTVPGLYNSGPEHWQSHWERQDARFRRVHQKDWETPRAEDWIAELDRAVVASGPDVLLAGHSLACCTIALWARTYKRRVGGALLVAPSDTESPSYPPVTHGFAPMPLDAIAFPTLVVASSNDPYVSIERAKQFADAWGSRYVCIGDAGHINSDAGYGPWPEGLQLLRSLRRGRRHVRAR